MMNCDLFQEYINDYIDNSLPTELREDFEKHINECQDCKYEFEFLQSVLNALHTMPQVSVPDDFVQKLNMKIDLLEEEQLPKKSLISQLKSWKMYSAVAVCALLFVLIKPNITNILPQNEVPDIVIPPVHTEYALTPTADVPVQTDMDDSEHDENSENVESVENDENAVELVTPQIENNDTIDEKQTINNLPETKNNPISTPNTSVIDISSGTKMPVEPTSSIDEITTTPPIATSTPQNKENMQNDTEIENQGIIHEKTHTDDVQMASFRGIGFALPVPEAYEIVITNDKLDFVNTLLEKIKAIKEDGYYTIFSDNVNEFIEELVSNGVDYQPTSIKDIDNISIDDNFIYIYIVNK